MSGTSSVLLSTSDGTAKAVSDYTALANVSVSFVANVISKTVALPITGDTALEPNETFTVSLTSPTNAALADAIGTVTIVDDDYASLSVSDVYLNEGNSGTTKAVFTVTRSSLTGAPPTSR